MSQLIHTPEELSKLKEKLNGSLVATNGCFDILHVGHIRYLQKARAQGDYLIVGVNSDESVKKLKGPKRPINKQEDRAEILNALKCVDYTFIFGGQTADEFLHLAKPNIYVKGGDYDLEKLPEKKTLEEINCTVIFVKFESGYSSTAVIERASC